MILFFIFILISITPLSLHAEERFLPSFRSSVVTNDGKPILRGGGLEPEEDEEQPVSDESEVSGEHINARHDSPRAMVEDLNVLIDYLINNYGYEIDKQTRRADDNDAGLSEEDFRSSNKKQPELIPQRRSMGDEEVGGSPNEVLAEAHRVREVLRKRRYWEKKAKKVFQHGVQRRHDMYADKTSPSRRANIVNETKTDTVTPNDRAKVVNKTNIKHASSRVRFFPHSWKNLNPETLYFEVGKYAVVPPKVPSKKKKDPPKTGFIHETAQKIQDFLKNILKHEVKH